MFYPYKNWFLLTVIDKNYNTNIIIHKSVLLYTTLNYYGTSCWLYNTESLPNYYYIGTICEDILEKWQLCATEQQYDEPNINSLVNQQQNEDLIVQLYSLLGE